MAWLGIVAWSEFPDGQQKMAVSSHLSSLVHKRCGNTKSPRSLFRTGFAGFFMRGGQMVVTVVKGDDTTVNKALQAADTSSVSTA